MWCWCTVAPQPAWQLRKRPIHKSDIREVSPNNNELDMENNFKKQLQSYIKDFVAAWTGFTKYILALPGLQSDDIKVCKDALELLSSDAPQRLIEEIMDAPCVQANTLDEAERFDNALNRMKLFTLPVSEEKRKEMELMGRGCNSLQKMILSAILKKQGRS